MVWPRSPLTTPASMPRERSGSSRTATWHCWLRHSAKTPDVGLSVSSSSDHRVARGGRLLVTRELTPEFGWLRSDPALRHAPSACHSQLGRPAPPTLLASASRVARAVLVHGEPPQAFALDQDPGSADGLLARHLLLTRAEHTAHGQQGKRAGAE